jgi:TPR repeat protein
MLFRANYGFSEWNREDSLDNRRPYTATKWGLLLCVPYYSRWLWKGRNGCKAANAGNFEAALNLWTPMARRGDAEAQYRIGLLYEQGTGLPQNPDQAARLYGRAAAQGHWRALWRIKKAAKAGGAVAQLCLGDFFNTAFGDNRDERQAQQWFERAAKQGLAEAQVHLGRTYLPPPSSWGFVGRMFTHLFGKWHGPKRDIALAIRWFRSASDRGNADGAFQLGLLYLLGHYVEQDVPAGLKLMEDAATKGLAHAQISLAVIYSEGEYLDPNPDRATHWFLKGESQIHKELEAETLVCLGIAFREGWGTAPNKVLAYKWFKLAEHKDRRRFRALFGPLIKDLKKTMTKGEIGQAIGLIETAHKEEVAFI